MGWCDVMVWCDGGNSGTIIGVIGACTKTCGCNK